MNEQTVAQQTIERFFGKQPLTQACKDGKHVDFTKFPQARCCSSSAAGCHSMVVPETKLEAKAMCEFGPCAHQGDTQCGGNTPFNTKAMCDGASCGRGKLEAKATCGQGGACRGVKGLMFEKPSQAELENVCHGEIGKQMLSENWEKINLGMPTCDLTRIRNRVAKEHPSLTPELLERGEQAYREFLHGIKLNPVGPHIPNLMVDEFWHAHVLHTKQYFEDCNNYFGYYLHHEPHGE